MVSGILGMQTQALCLESMHLTLRALPVICGQVDCGYKSPLLASCPFPTLPPLMYGVLGVRKLVWLRHDGQECPPAQPSPASWFWFSEGGLS